MTAERDPTLIERAWAYGLLASMVAIIGGAYASVFVGLPGALLMLGGVCVRVGLNLVVGVSEYRLVMAREWPKVRSLDDEDDDF